VIDCHRAGNGASHYRAFLNTLFQGAHPSRKFSMRECVGVDHVWIPQGLLQLLFTSIEKNLKSPLFLFFFPPALSPKVHPIL
jgi:hypothetical protein